MRVAVADDAVMVLSQFVQARYAVELLAQGTERVGYLLKDRVSDLDELATSVRRIGEGCTPRTTAKKRYEKATAWHLSGSMRSRAEPRRLAALLEVVVADET